MAPDHPSCRRRVANPIPHRLGRGLISVAADPVVPTTPAREARAEYEVGHYEAAFAAFAALADEGQCDAARIASQMARLGRALYPVSFQVDAERLQRWQQGARCPPAVMAGR